VVRSRPFGEAAGAVGPIRYLDVEVGGDGEGASVKESVIPHPFTGRPCLTGKDLPGYLVTHGRQPTLSLQVGYVPHSPFSLLDRPVAPLICGPALCRLPVYCPGCPGLFLSITESPSP
jgi:hypothetical protein